MIKILTIFIQDTRPAGPKTRNNDNPDYHQNLRFAPLGCPAMFRRARPQPRLQHEAKCWWVDSWFGYNWCWCCWWQSDNKVGGRCLPLGRPDRLWGVASKTTSHIAGTETLFSLTIKRTTPLGWVHDYALQRLTWSPSMGVGLLVLNRKRAGVSNWVK